MRADECAEAFTYTSFDDVFDGDFENRARRVRRKGGKTYARGEACVISHHPRVLDFVADAGANPAKKSARKGVVTEFPLKPKEGKNRELFSFSHPRQIRSNVVGRGALEGCIHRNSTDAEGSAPDIASICWRRIAGRPSVDDAAVQRAAVGQDIERLRDEAAAGGVAALSAVDPCICGCRRRTTRNDRSTREGQSRRPENTADDVFYVEANFHRC